MKRLYLTYPSSWRMHIDTPIEFNWFMCSKRYREPATGNYILEIPSGTKFYEESTGMSYKILSRDPPIKLLEIINETPKDMEKYDGIAVHSRASSNVSFKCNEAIFGIKEGVLKSSSSSKCELIKYSKTFYDKIKMFISNFPTPEEIDEMLVIRSCPEVCKELYEMLKKQ